MKKALFVLAVAMCSFTLVASAGAMPYITGPVLVTQPVYDGMSFYVYHPYNMPSGWFVTYDGYPVSRCCGRWVYGLPNGCGGWYSSSYVVGAVVPTAIPQLCPFSFPSHHCVCSPCTVPSSFCPGYPVPQWVVNRCLARF